MDNKNHSNVKDNYNKKHFKKEVSFLGVPVCMLDEKTQKVIEGLKRKPFRKPFKHHHKQHQGKK